MDGGSLSVPWETQHGELGKKEEKLVMWTCFRGNEHEVVKAMGTGNR